jgi:putative ABC transport system permease protein
MLSVNIYKQVEQGFFATDGQYDIVVGKRGSATTLVMSSLYFSSDAIGTIPYSEYEALKENTNLATVIPLAMGDSYRGSNIVGATPELLDGKTLQDGKLYANRYEAVVGYNVAKLNGLVVGDDLLSTHGLGGMANDHKQTYKLVGILDETKTAYDNVLFTPIESLWESHGIGSDEHSETEEHSGEEVTTETEDTILSEDDLVHADEELEITDDRVLTSVIIRSENMKESTELISSYKDNESIQALNPTQTLRTLMSNLDLSRQVAQILVSIIIALAFVLIAIMTVVMFESNRKDVQTLRFIGLKRSLITRFVLYQNAFLLYIGIFFSIILSRLALYVTNNISSKMGIILDIGKVYQLEFIVVAGVVILCIIPVIFQLNSLFKERV